MAKAQYFVEVDSYWQNSVSYFVGPFADKAQADAWIEAIVSADNNVWRSDRHCGGNIKDATRVYAEPRTKTEAMRRGLRLDTTLNAATEPTEAALNAAIRWVRQVAAEAGIA